jgi:hypothetical protein
LLRGIPPNLSTIRVVSGANRRPVRGFGGLAPGQAVGVGEAATADRRWPASAATQAAGALTGAASYHAGRRLARAGATKRAP